MKYFFSCIFILCVAFIFTQCKSTKKELSSTDGIDIFLITELKKGVDSEKIENDLPDYSITKIKATNKTLNQHLYTVRLKGQTSDQALRAFRSLDYVISAAIAPTGTAPAENMPSGKVSKTGPIKG